MPIEHVKTQLPQIGKILPIAIVMLLVLLSWYTPISEEAKSQVDEGLKRSLVSFASARVLNGVISVAQGTQVAVQPLGVGVALSVGEILDPINDLVEAFSTVMLTASVAFGVQKLLLTIGSNWMISAVVSGFAAVWAVLYFANKAPGWLSRLVVILLFIRFVMPVVTLGSAAVFENLMKQDYEVNQSEIDMTSKTLKGVTVDTPELPSAPPSDVPTESLSSWEKLKGMADSAKSAATGVLKNPLPGALAKYEQIKSSAERAAQKMITLIVIFLMQTIFIPLILVWVLYRLMGGMLERRPT